ncbi:exodeoxyribonuclease III [Halenospora varia]|nr:exodeoxyribonuclease III [Halenospora varia]
MSDAVLPKNKRDRPRTLEKDVSPPPPRRLKTSAESASHSSATINKTFTSSPTLPSPDIPLGSPKSSTKPTSPSFANNRKPSPNPNRLEIISWNVNSIEHLLPPDTKNISTFFKRKRRSSTSPRPESESGDQEENEISPLRAFLQRHKYPALLCLQEVKIVSKDEERYMSRITRAVNTSSKVGEVRYNVHLNLPKDKFNARGLGGTGKVHGVCTLVRSHPPLLAGCNIEVETKTMEWDLEGRILVTLLKPFPSTKIEDDGKFDEGGSKKEEGKRLVIVNGYWPNGTTNPYRDSNTGEVVGTRHDFKRSFHARMFSEVGTWEAKGCQVVLIGDMNIAPHCIDGFPNLRIGAEHVRNRADFNSKFLDEKNEKNEGSMQGVDSFRWVNGEERKYSYHGEPAAEWGRSCDRVDLGVVSKNFVNGLGTRWSLVNADIYESVEERGRSDHVPISVVVEFAGDLNDERNEDLE